MINICDMEIRALGNGNMSDGWYIDSYNLVCRDTISLESLSWECEYWLEELGWL